MTTVQENPNLVACCGLYCGACRSHLAGKCPGCEKNTKATWCTIRTCCAAKNIRTCAECKDFPNPGDCNKFNNFISKLFGLVFRSDRAACIAQIKLLGIAGHAKVMAEQKKHTIRRGSPQV